MVQPQHISEGRNNKIKMCLVAEPGIGKTTLAGTSPGGLIIRPPSDHTDAIPDDSQCDEVVVRTWDDMEEVYEALRHQGWKNSVTGEPYQWVWLDSISAWQDYGVDELFEAAVERKPSRAEFGPDKGEYGINMNRIGRWVRQMCGLEGFHFGITAHPERIEDMDGDLLLMPHVTGKNMPQRIAGYMTIVSHLVVRRDNEGNDRRVLISKKDEKYYAKDQHNRLPARMPDPTIPKIEQRLFGKRRKKG